MDCWEQLVKKLEDEDSEEYIYRGQTNGFCYLSGKYTPWNLQSSYTRQFGKWYSFWNFITQQLDKNLFKSYYSKYGFSKNYGLHNSKLLEKIYFLQHYGVPTCFIDFTHDPLVATYFSISGILRPGVMRYQNNISISYPEDASISVYRISTKKLQELGLKDISKNFCWEYEQFQFKDEYDLSIHAALDMRPELILSNSLNQNLINQKSCFILFDNTSDSHTICMSLEDFIIQKCIEASTDIPIDIFTLSYNLIFGKYNRHSNDYRTLFKYLKDNNITGENLFEDIQGLKYDFNFFHD